MRREGGCRPSQPLDGKKDRLHFTTGSAQPAPSGHLCCPQKAQRPYILRRGSVDFSCPPTWWCRFGSFFCTVLPAERVSPQAVTLLLQADRWRPPEATTRPPCAPPPCSALILDALTPQRTSTCLLVSSQGCSFYSHPAYTIASHRRTRCGETPFPCPQCPYSAALGCTQHEDSLWREALQV